MIVRTERGSAALKRAEDYGYGHHFRDCKAAAVATWIDSFSGAKNGWGLKGWDLYDALVGAFNPFTKTPTDQLDEVWDLYAIEPIGAISGQPRSVIANLIASTYEQNAELVSTALSEAS